MIYTIILLLLGLGVYIYCVSRIGYGFFEKVLIAIMGIGIYALWFLISLFPLNITGFHYETGRGEHTGIVTAVQKQGVFYKTGRAYIKTGTQSSQEDTYCVIDEQVYLKLQELSKEKKQVTIKYLSYLSAGIKNCDGEDDIIYEVN